MQKEKSIEFILRYTENGVDMPKNISCEIKTKGDGFLLGDLLFVSGSTFRAFKELGGNVEDLAAFLVRDSNNGKIFDLNKIKSDLNNINENPDEQNPPTL